MSCCTRLVQPPTLWSMLPRPRHRSSSTVRRVIAVFIVVTTRSPLAAVTSAGSSVNALDFLVYLMPPVLRPLRSRSDTDAPRHHRRSHTVGAVGRHWRPAWSSAALATPRTSTDRAAGRRQACKEGKSATAAAAASTAGPASESDGPVKGSMENAVLSAYIALLGCLARNDSGIKSQIREQLPGHSFDGLVQMLIAFLQMHSQSSVLPTERYYIVVLVVLT